MLIGIMLTLLSRKLFGKTTEAWERDFGIEPYSYLGDIVLRGNLKLYLKHIFTLQTCLHQGTRLNRVSAKW